MAYDVGGAGRRYLADLGNPDCPGCTPLRRGSSRHGGLPLGPGFSQLERPSSSGAHPERAEEVGTAPAAGPSNGMGAAAALSSDLMHHPARVNAQPSLGPMQEPRRSQGAAKFDESDFHFASAHGDHEVPMPQDVPVDLHDNMLASAWPERCLMGPVHEVAGTPTGRRMPVSVGALANTAEVVDSRQSMNFASSLPATAAQHAQAQPAVAAPDSAPRCLPAAPWSAPVPAHVPSAATAPPVPAQIFILNGSQLLEDSAPAPPFPHTAPLESSGTVGFAAAPRAQPAATSAEQWYEEPLLFVRRLPRNASGTSPQSAAAAFAAAAMAAASTAGLPNNTGPSSSSRSSSSTSALHGAGVFPGANISRPLTSTPPSVASQRQAFASSEQPQDAIASGSLREVSPSPSVVPRPRRFGQRSGPPEIEEAARPQPLGVAAIEQAAPTPMPQPPPIASAPSLPAPALTASCSAAGTAVRQPTSRPSDSGGMTVPTDHWAFRGSAHRLSLPSAPACAAMASSFRAHEPVEAVAGEGVPSEPDLSAPAQRARCSSEGPPVDDASDLPRLLGRRQPMEVETPEFGCAAICASDLNDHVGHPAQGSGPVQLAQGSGPVQGRGRNLWDKVAQRQQELRRAAREREAEAYESENRARNRSRMDICKNFLDRAKQGASRNRARTGTPLDMRQLDGNDAAATKSKDVFYESPGRGSSVATTQYGASGSGSSSSNSSGSTSSGQQASAAVWQGPPSWRSPPLEQQAVGSVQSPVTQAEAPTTQQTAAKPDTANTQARLRGVALAKKLTSQVRERTRESRKASATQALGVSAP